VQGAGEGGEEDCGGEGGEEGEEGGDLVNNISGLLAFLRADGWTHNGHDPRAQASPATANRQQADDDCDHSRPECDLVCDEVPLGDALVDFDGRRRSVSEHVVLEFLRVLFRIVDGALDSVVSAARSSRDLCVCRIETELLYGVEDEARLSVAAVVDVAGSLVCAAVVPEVDAVGLFELTACFGERQGCCELGGVAYRSGVCGSEVAEVDGHQVVVVQW